MFRSIFSGFLVLGVGAAVAAPVNIDFNRSVTAGITNPTPGGDGTTSTAGGLFNATAIWTVAGSPYSRTIQASQQSDLQANIFSGNGEVNADFSFYGAEAAYAESFFSVEFDLLSAHSYDLSGVFTDAMDANPDASSSTVRLVDLSGSLIFEFVDNSMEWGPDPFASIGTLSAGSYALYVDSQISKGSTPDTGAYGGQRSYSFNLELTATPTPEPATMLLFGTGLVGLIGIGARKKKK